MKAIYTLKEIEEMKKATRGAIANIIRTELENKGSCTARELAEATNGLCSTMHIASSVSAHVYNVRFNSWDSDYNKEVHLKVVKSDTKLKKRFAELDDFGNIVRVFEREVELPCLYSLA